MVRNCFGNIKYHRVKFNEHGIVTDGTIVVPTGQNQIAIEWDIRQMLNEKIERGMVDLGQQQQKIGDATAIRSMLQGEIEQLIRVYDPCMSCASHFLKFKWL